MEVPHFLSICSFSLSPPLTLHALLSIFLHKLTHLFHNSIIGLDWRRKRLMSMRMDSDEKGQLTERRKAVLRLVVQEYVRTAQPVGSAAGALQAQLDVSPATIRNDLAALESLGLLTHPHTSAGRIPTDAGYRYYVHNLMPSADLPAAEQNAMRQELALVRQDPDLWVSAGTAMLARTAQGAALATAPRSVRNRFKHMELVALYGVKVLMVLVLQDGAVKQQTFDLDLPLEQSALSQTSNEINDRLAGHDAAEIAGALEKLTPFAQQVAQVVSTSIQSSDTQLSGQIYREGLAQVLEEPEFAEGDPVRRIVRVFEQRSLLDQIVGEMEEGDDLRILIAGDGRVPELRDISLIISRYGAGDRASGVLGVVGPVRMAYGRSVGAVRFVAGLMSEIVEDLYGRQ